MSSGGNQAVIVRARRQRNASLRKGVLGKHMMANPHPRVDQIFQSDQNTQISNPRPSRITSPDAETSEREAGWTRTQHQAAKDMDMPSPIAPGSDASALSQRRQSEHAITKLPAETLVSPLSNPVNSDWDYSETAYWGWVILIATWTIFVVGMGSCLGIWSWAWDVGETPFAPPDLEDDPTLPIVGYYPALIVCTAIMAWIWVVVAWVGMKFFRHAKVVIDS